MGFRLHYVWRRWVAGFITFGEMGCGLAVRPQQTINQPLDPFLANINAQLDQLEYRAQRLPTALPVPTEPAGHSGDEHGDGRFVRAVDRRYKGLEDRTWTGEWTFALMADVQLGMLEGNYPASGESWEVEMQMAARCVAHVNTMQPRPKFVIICGDLVDAAPPAAKSTADKLPDMDEDSLNRQQMRDFKKVFSQVDSDIPLVCVCGNHDVGDMPNRQTVQLWQRDFGDDYYEFWCGGCRFLVLNSQLFAAQDPNYNSNNKFSGLHETHKQEAEELAAEQAEWLSKQLQSGSECTHLMAISHIPPFVLAPDEPDGYCNYEPSVRGPLLEQLKAAGCTKWFAGHYHSNSGGWDEDLEVVVTGAAGSHIPLEVPRESELAANPAGQDFSNVQCSEMVSGMRLVRVGEKEVKHAWYTVAQLDQGQHLSMTAKVNICMQN